MLRSKKDGQVTLFVIVGVVLVVVTTFLFFSGNLEFLQSYDTRLKNEVSEVVDNCLEEVTLRGVFLLGVQGGYIEIPEAVSLDPRRHTSFGFEIPNWDSEFGEVPSVSFMKSELDLFIRDEALVCVRRGLSALDERFNISLGDTFFVSSQVNPESVVVEAELPIRFNEWNSDEVLFVSDFFVRLDSLRLGDIFDLALQIYGLEGSTYFLEDLILDQIYSASDYSSPQSMPTEGMVLSCARRVWTVEQLKRNLANLNNNNFKYLYFEGTESIDDVFEANLNEEFGTEDLRDYFESHYSFLLPNTRSSFENYGVEVFMPSTEITGESGYFKSYPYREFEVTPSSGGVVKSDDFKVDLDLVQMPIPCVQIFHHLYDLDYDLVFRITDLSEEGGGYVFQFPVRVVIAKNEPKFEPVSFIGEVEPTADNEAFCSEENRIYPLRIIARDDEGEFLSDVNVTYKCISLTCDLGQTQRPTFRGIVRREAVPVLDTQFPFCIGGRVIVEKEGYHKGEIRIDTDESLIGRSPVPVYEVEMVPVLEFGVDATTFLFKRREDGKSVSRAEVESGSVYVSLENDERDFLSEAIWPNDGEFLNSLKLLEMEGVAYNVSVIYADSQGELRGFLEIENWKPTLSELYGGDEILFVVPASSEAIDIDSYFDFYEFMRGAVESGAGGYGISFR